MKVFSRPTPLQIQRATWNTMVGELEARGGGTRESGAFLLGDRRRHRARVTDIVYFDDIEPESLNGAVHLTMVGYSQLWAICTQLGLEVLGDVHTHPGDLVGQSGTDQDNPLVAQVGHLALIVPRYASGHICLRDVGVYEYLGDEGWRDRPRGVRHRRWF